MSIIGSLVDRAESAANSVKDKAESLASGAEDKAKSVVHGAESAAKGAEARVADAWNSAVKDVKNLVDDGKSKAAAQLHNSVGQLKNDGDQTTLNVSASGTITDDDPVGGQAKDAGSITIKQVGGTSPTGSTPTGKPASYQVTLTETQQVGLNESLQEGTTKKNAGKASVEVNAGVTNSVTVTVSSKADAERVAKTYAKLLVANNVQMDTESSLTNGQAPIAKAVGFVNPISDAINGSNAAENLPQNATLKLEGVKSSDLSFLKSHMTNSSHTLTLSGNVGASVSAGDLLAKIPAIKNNPDLKSVLNVANLNVKDDGSLSLTRTLTNAAGGKKANVAYTLAAKSTTTDGLSAKLPVKAKLPSPQEQANLQTSVKASYDLDSAADLGHPEQVLARQGAWKHPTQVQLTSTAQSNPSVDTGVGYKGGIVDTDTRTLTLNHAGDGSNLRLFGDALKARLTGDTATAQRDEKALDNDLSETETRTRATRSVSAPLSFNPSIGAGPVKIGVGLDADITTDRLLSSQTWPV